MAAYAALLSLARTTDLKDLNRDRGQYFFSLDAEEKIRSIHEYVMFLLSFFDDLPEKASRMEGEIRDVAHKIEDIIEHFMWQKMKSSHTPMKPSSVKLEDQLQNVTVRIGLIAGEMMEERPAYLPAAVSLSSISAATGNDRPIGLDEDLMAIKERLCGHSSTLQIIPIVGMGGVGKTTLAKAVYDDPLIQHHFYIRAWLTLSQEYSAHRLRQMLLGLIDSIKLPGEQFCGEKIDESEIALKVYQTLKGKRFLIVMDDVWGRDFWDDVRSIIPDDNNGSRIVLTTRLLDVAAYPHSGSRPHEMRLMDDDQSWNLLKQKVFPNNYCPADLEHVGREIARKCAGLPLAVVLVAGVLSANSADHASWEEIAKDLNPVVGEGLGKILSFSYTHLPHHLRPCFLFIGGFPEDELIRASKLVKLWVAEGFLTHHNEDGKCLEDEAEGYLEDLVKRNLVLVASRRKSDGKVKSCSLHDTVRDLCVRKAREEKFLHAMDGSKLPRVDIIVHERRISFNQSDIDNIWCPTIRTILCFQPQEFSSWQAFLRSSRLLKVLNAVGYNVHKEFPSPVFEQFHLTYLALVGSFKVPSAISNLVNLQTLIIYPTFERKQIRNWQDFKNAPHHDMYLPLEIWRMARLRHVILYDLYKLPHPPHGSNLPLQNLQTLSTILDLGWNEKVVEMIPNVKELRLVYHTDYQEYCNLHHLMSLQQLEKLEVYGYRGFSWRVQNLVFPPSLKKLTLGGGEYPWEEMGIIGSLPNLQVLKLLDKACNGETWETSDEQFLELRYLLIDGLDLQEWITERSHFPRLTCLVLRSCRHLREIPKSIGDVPTLVEIEVYNCGMSVAESAELIEQEQHDLGNDVLQVRIVDQATVEHRLQKKCSKYRGKQLSTACTDEDLMAIKERLCGHSSTLQIIPIVGMGGIGKTTLARTLYGDSLIREHFDIRAWVTLSQDYNTHTLRNILLCLVDSIKLSGKQLCGEKIDESEIALKVYQTLKGKRFLIVMDDVWGRDFWDDLRSIIPDDNNGSRIMLTTRLLDVAAYPHSGSRPHEMRLMDDDQSWNLLKQKVFPNNYCPADLEHVGREIARKCAGLPLAVVLVAGVLSADSADHASWEEIAKDLNPVVGEGLGEILSFSYTHLPHHLRPCFLFIGVFPEDKLIRASKLVKLWVAKGFLTHHNEDGKCLEDEAEGYLEDLVKRNLVQVASRRKSDGKVKSCSLHDTVRDLCVRKAHEEKFLGWNEKVVEMIPNVKELRLVYHTDCQECNLHHLMSLQQLENLEVYGYRGFSWRVQNLVFPPSLTKLTLGGGEYPWEEMGIIGSLPNLQVLRLLDKACTGETWETSDEQFLELRYLLIDGLDLQEWITERSHFPQLTRLVLRSCRHLREIPDSIGEITTLVEIEVYNCGMSVVESAKFIEQEQDSLGNDVLQVRIVDLVTVEHRLGEGGDRLPILMMTSQILATPLVMMNLKLRSLTKRSESCSNTYKDSLLPEMTFKGSFLHNHSC